MSSFVKGTLGRRDFLRASLAAGGGAAALAHAPWLLNQTGHLPGYSALYAQFLRDPLARSMDGLAYLADAVGGGLSALRLVDTAYADTPAVNDTYFVNINVTCGICPKFFTVFGTPDVNNRLPNGLLVDAGKMTDTKAYLRTAGLEKITANARWKDSLRMTQWFSDILTNGTEDGLAASAGSTNVPDAVKRYIGTFPDGINLQVAHGLKGGVSHLFSSLLLGAGTSSIYGDINYELAKGGLISPLQILAFGLFGDGVKDINCGENRISGPAFSTELIGKTTESFLTTVKQLVADSYVRTDSCDAKNPICSFDSLARSKEASALRKTMLARVAEIKSAITSMAPNIDAVTKAKHRFDPAMGMRAPVIASAALSNEAPKAGFLSQVATTCELLKNLDCYRNFSLFLNLVDLDGDNYDTLRNNETVEGVGQNYVNGSRQIGIALNMLAKVMKDSGKKIIVQVCADTGRSSTSAVDAEASTAFLMAPAAVGLKDYMYVNNSVLADDSTVSGRDPSANPVAWGKDLKKADGSDDLSGMTDYKHWAAGVYKLIIGARFHNEAYVEIKKA